MTSTSPASAPTSRQRAQQRISFWDRAAVSLLGILGFALSYAALQQVALAVHIPRLLTYAYPPLVDGFIAYGVRAILVLRAAPLHARLYAWMLFGTATAASIWANALHALDLNKPGTTELHLGDFAVVVLAAIPPLSLAGATHLHVLISRYSTTSDLVPVTAGSDPDPMPPTAPHLGDVPASAALPPQGRALEGVSAIAEPTTAETPATVPVPAAPGSAPEVEPAEHENAGGNAPDDSGPRRGGRPPLATDQQLVEVLLAAPTGPDLMTREDARAALAAAGLGAGNDRLRDALALARAQSEARQHPDGA
ncbi:DUF2637 domain-containing protein [Streptacidiphilus cavernicola]|uniref:DUF2637 domain-containing protein n=1 Tax=Streptacidiphilus cavernicola TaxID=3342716 RepID=A0ABV6VW70_9ACTN